MVWTDGFPKISKRSFPLKCIAHIQISSVAASLSQLLSDTKLSVTLPRVDMRSKSNRAQLATCTSRVVSSKVLLTS